MRWARLRPWQCAAIGLIVLLGHAHGIGGMWLETLTLSATALFAGAALYVSFVEHPARLSCGSAPALAEWRPSYKRGTLMQAPLAIAAALLGLACWWNGGGWLWLVGAILIGSLVPFTIVVIFPTNHRLEDAALDGTSD